MKLYAYETAPIDYWAWTMSFVELIGSLASKDEWGSDSVVMERARDALALRAHARSLFGQIGWEGDGREAWFAVPDPHNNDMACGYIVKQGNNGTTFVACTVELLHLANDPHYDGRSIYA